MLLPRAKSPGRYNGNMGKIILFIILVFLSVNAGFAITTPELANELAAKTSDEERNQLLAQNPGLISADLAKEILTRGEEKRRQGEYDFAVSLFDLARRISDQAHYEVGIASSWNATARANRSRGNYKEALEQFERAMEIGKKLNDKPVLADSLAGIAALKKERGDMNGAISGFEQAHSYTKNSETRVALQRCSPTSESC